jgi:anti-sigma regulatory factor (Ser/Thr protein kinase)
MRELLVVFPFPWVEVGLTPEDWPNCHVTEAWREADALEHLRTGAVDVVLTNAGASTSRVFGLAQQARMLQPGVRIIVLAPALTPSDIIQALRGQVFACFTLPVEPGTIRAIVSDALEADGAGSSIEVLSGVPHWIALRVACRRVNADRLSHFMGELAAELPGTERDHLIAAFREILLNAMEHGAGFDPSKVVDVAAVRTSRTIVFYFKDPGPGFNVASPPHVASENDPISHLSARDEAGLRVGGFGMLLTKKLVDEVHYNEQGNEVILVKYID